MGLQDPERVSGLARVCLHFPGFHEDAEASERGVVKDCTRPSRFTLCVGRWL